MPKMTPENERVVKGLERLIRIDERSKLEDIATSQHDEHEDNWGQSKVYDAVNEGVIDHDTWAYCEPCDCESPFLRKSCLVCGSGIETDLFEDLELLLSKHLGVDWTWEYKGEGHPLMINSEHLPKLWEKMVESEVVN